MGALRKALLAFSLMIFFTGIFILMNGAGIVDIDLNHPLYPLIFFLWIFFEVTISTM